MPETRQFHLHREYPTAPFRRYAATVVADARDPYYRVTRYDPAVADPAFLAALHDGLLRPLQTMEGGLQPDGCLVDRPVVRNPGEPGHLAQAVRSMSGIGLGAPPAG